MGYQIVFKSKSEEVRFRILEYMKAKGTPARKKEIVDYIWSVQEDDTPLTAGMISGAFSVLVDERKLLSDGRGAYRLNNAIMANANNPKMFETLHYISGQLERELKRVMIIANEAKEPWKWYGEDLYNEMLKDTEEMLNYLGGYRMQLAWDIHKSSEVNVSNIEEKPMIMN